MCTERQAMDSIAAMETNGMRDAGYNYVTLDDCFAMHRSAAGVAIDETVILLTLSLHHY